MDNVGLEPGDLPNDPGAEGEGKRDLVVPGAREAPGADELGAVELGGDALVGGDDDDLVAHLPEVLDEVLEAVLVAGDVGEGGGLDEERDAAGPRVGLRGRRRRLVAVVPQQDGGRGSRGGTSAST